MKPNNLKKKKQLTNVIPSSFVVLRVRKLLQKESDCGSFPLGAEPSDGGGLMLRCVSAAH